MSVDREDTRLKRLRREAKRIRQGQEGVSQTQALDMIAGKLGFKNWQALVRDHRSRVVEN